MGAGGGRAAGHGALPLPHQGAGPGPAAELRRPRRAGPAGRLLRRRHRPRGAGLGPALGLGGADQPRHAPRRPAPPPRSLGHVPQAVALRGGRRAAHAAGHLRLARRPPAAAAATGVRGLRVVAHVRVLLGHDRHARGAGVRPVRAPRRARHRRRLASRRAAVRPVEPADARPGHGPTGVAQRRDGGAPGRAGGRLVPGHRLLPEPTGHRAGGGRHRAPGRPRAGRDGEALPGRLPARGAAGGRGRAVRRAAAGGGGHQRTGARGRHRRARRLRARRLPGDHRLALAAGRSGRPGPAAVAGRAGGRRGPARPVAHGPPRGGVPAPARAGGRQPDQPVRGPPPPRLRGLRAAPHPRGRRLVGRPARRGGAHPRAGRPTGGAGRPGVLGRAGVTGVGRRAAQRGGRGVPGRPSTTGA